MLKVVIAEFPYIDNPNKRKTRPALCLTKPTGKHDIVIVAFITRNTEENLPTDIILDVQDKEFSKTKLHTTSCIKLHKLVSVPLANLHGEIGILPQAYEAQVKQKLRQLFNT